jgi:hypothetical protein
MRRVWLVIGLALLLRAPVLGWGFFMDDLGHQLVLEDPSVSPTMSRFNVYDFGYPAQPGEELFEQGAWPWWTSSDWKARFFRPVTSLSLALDQKLFGRWAPGHHATGLALFGLLLALVHALYRRIGLDAPTALLALLLVALEDGSVLVVGWVANRNTLFEALFGVSALLVALRGTGWVAVGLAALAALSKESGVLFLPFVGAALWSRGARGAALLAIALSVAHPLALFAADFGIRTPMYPTPWSADGPGPFLAQVALTLTAQPPAMLSPFPVDILVQTPEGVRVALWVGLLLTVPLVLLIRRGARNVPHARALALFGLLALVPRAMAPPSDRLVLVPFLALAPLAATWLRAGLARRPIPSIPAVLVALAAVPASGLMLLARAASLGPIMRRLEAPVLEAEVGEQPRDLVVLNYPTPLAGFNPGTVWHFRTGEERRFFSMQMGRRGLGWTRVDERTFDLTSLDEPFLQAFFEPLFLSSRAPPAPGTRWTAAAFEVEALEVDDEGLRTIRVRWNGPLEESDGGPRFLAWRDDRLRALAPPAPGDRVQVESAPRLMPWFP